MLNHSGIAVSKSTQRRPITTIAENHELIVIDFVADAIEKMHFLS